MSLRRSAIALAMLATPVLVAACLGRPSAEAPPRPAPAKAAASSAPPTPEKDWRAAAQGHGAAGPIPRDVLDRMERESAPGGTRPPLDGAHPTQ